MKYLKIRNIKTNQSYDCTMEDDRVEPYLYRKEPLGHFGRPERWVRAKIENPDELDSSWNYRYPDEIYDDEDVIDTKVEIENSGDIDENGEFIMEEVTYVLLRADYTIEISDYKIVPKEVTMRQARIALIRSGLYETIQNAITNSNDEELKVDWEYSQTVQRNWENLIALTVSLGMTSDQVDDLFILAGSL